MRRISGSTRASAEQRVVDVVEVRGIEIAIALVPRGLVAVAEDDELELGPGERAPTAFRQPRELPAQDLPWRGEHLAAVKPREIGDANGGAVLPGDDPQRVEIGLHQEVAVTALPRGHRKPGDGRHVDVDGEQVVAALRAVLSNVIDEVLGDEALSHQTPLHVRDREKNGVDGTARDLLSKLV
jgi:hypothetical protein